MLTEPWCQPSEHIFRLLMNNSDFLQKSDNLSQLKRQVFHGNHKFCHFTFIGCKSAFSKNCSQEFYLKYFLKNLEMYVHFTSFNKHFIVYGLIHVIHGCIRKIDNNNFLKDRISYPDIWACLIFRPVGKFHAFILFYYFF